MKRLLIAGLALSFLVAAVAMSGGQKQSSGDLEIQSGERNPWTNLKLNNAAETFSFAIVSDRTGGHRAKIFSQAVEQLNMLQPTFVLSVGDLIEGYSKDPTILNKQWQEMQGYVQKLQMPFFYATGNHDVANSAETKEWEARFGRRYYHFLYKDVLFLMMSTDDPYEEAGGGRMSKEQVEWVAKVLKDNAKIRWTILSLHKPIWTQKTMNGWEDVEKLLAGRSYTVFAGHKHFYQKFVRNGMSYYQLATTGGVSKMRGVKYGEFDHIAWVTMKKEGPVIANILLDGIYPESMQFPLTDEKGSTRKMKQTHPVSGTVRLDGTAVGGAKVSFYLVEQDGKKKTLTADALTEADGTFTLTTYQANDGAQAGDYVVTVVQRQPEYDAAGKPGPNRLPAKYAGPQTTDLKTQVKSGPNVISVQLTR